VTKLSVADPLETETEPKPVAAEVGGSPTSDRGVKFGDDKEVVRTEVRMFNKDEPASMTAETPSNFDSNAAGHSASTDGALRFDTFEKPDAKFEKFEKPDEKFDAPSSDSLKFDAPKSGGDANAGGALDLDLGVIEL